MEKTDFRRFYKKHVDKVYRFVYFRVGNNRDVAEDLTSEIFMKALNAFAKYDPAKSESAWINTIARNHLINHYRDRKDLDDIDDYAFKLEGEDGEETAVVNEETQFLQKALSELQPKEKLVVEMKYLEGYRYKDIGKILGKTAGAVRVEAHRAIVKLKKLLSEIK